MTTLLQKAFAEAAKLPDVEQELLASWMLAELGAENDFDRAIANSSDKLARLAADALAEHRAGLTEGIGGKDLIACIAHPPLLQESRTRSCNENTRHNPCWGWQLRCCPIASLLELYPKPWRFVGGLAYGPMS